MVSEASDPSPSPPRPEMSAANAPGVPRRAPRSLPAIKTSILALVLVVAACAMAFTALRTGSRLWYTVLYTFTAFLLLTAVLCARFRRGNERAFWFGFAVFGWGFFLMGLGTWMNPFADSDEPAGNTLNPNLLTTRVILFLLPYLRTDTNSLTQINPITENTIGIAHLLVALILALVGGILAVLLRRRPRGRTSIKSLTVVAGLALIASIATTALSTGPAVRSSRLSVLHENSLGDLAGRDHDATVYHLSWLPTFHHPVFVRIERTGEGARLHAKVLDGKGGYEPGQVAIERRLALGAEQRDRLDWLIEQAAFWEPPTRRKEDMMVLDGDHIILAGVKGGKYHVVYQEILDPPYETLCHYMLELTNIDLGEQWTDYHPVESRADVGPQR